MTSSDEAIEAAQAWAAQRLRSLRKERPGLSQEVLGDLAGFDRTTISKLERTRVTDRRMNRDYAAAIAPVLSKHLKREVTVEELLPPGSAVGSTADPLALLHELRATADRQQETIDSQGRAIRALQARVRTLERGQEKPRRAGGAG